MRAGSIRENIAFRLLSSRLALRRARRKLVISAKYGAIVRHEVTIRFIGLLAFLVIIGICAIVATGRTWR